MAKRQMLGLVEAVEISFAENRVKILARIDTGATTSSIDLSLAKKLSLPKSQNSKIIKSASGIGKRAVVSATVKISSIEIEADFTVANRSHMTYPLLIGQNILKQGRFLIDPLKQLKPLKQIPPTQEQHS